MRVKECQKENNNERYCPECRRLVKSSEHYLCNVCIKGIHYQMTYGAEDHKQHGVANYLRWALKIPQHKAWVLAKQNLEI